MKILCEKCRYCKALTKIEGNPSFLVCGKRQFAQNYPTIKKCVDYLEDTDEIPMLNINLEGK